MGGPFRRRQPLRHQPRGHRWGVPERRSDLAHRHLPRPFWSPGECVSTARADLTTAISTQVPIMLASVMMVMMPEWLPPTECDLLLARLAAAHSRRPHPWPGRRDSAGVSWIGCEHGADQRYRDHDAGVGGRCAQI